MLASHRVTSREAPCGGMTWILPPLSLSFSLSHTHTHITHACIRYAHTTHTRTHTHIHTLHTHPHTLHTHPHTHTAHTHTHTHTLLLIYNTLVGYWCCSHWSFSGRVLHAVRCTHLWDVWNVWMYWTTHCIPSLWVIISLMAGLCMCCTVYYISLMYVRTCSCLQVG